MDPRGWTEFTDSATAPIHSREAGLVGGQPLVKMIMASQIAMNLRGWSLRTGTPKAWTKHVKSQPPEQVESQHIFRQGLQLIAAMIEQPSCLIE